MSFPSYAKYGNSGVGWLGQVPAHWQTAKFRHLFRESPEKIEALVVGPMLSVSGYRGVEVKEYDDENRRRLDEDLVGYRVVRVGQLVVNTMWLNYAGLGVSEHEGHVSPAYRSYHIHQDMDRRFVHYLLRSETYVQGYTRLLTGIRPNSLQMSRDDLMEFPVLVPPKSEQATIAAFLDRETAKIDELVVEQRRLIGLLKAKRQAIISHVITKGLDPAAPMKPSGIEWTGDVPTDWEVWKLAHAFAQIGSGTTPRTDRRDYYDDGETPWVNTGDLCDGELESCEKRITELALADHSSLKIYPSGSLLIAMYGATIGKLGILSFPATVNQACCVFAGESPIEVKFLFYWFVGFRQQIVSLAIGGGQPNVNQEILRSLRLACPGKPEQLAIIEFLDIQTARLDTLTVAAERAIELLQERRTALISATVTGQIDVRGLVESVAA